jgi:hypothetical protein
VRHLAPEVSPEHFDGVQPGAVGERVKQSTNLPAPAASDEGVFPLSAWKRSNVQDVRIMLLRVASCFVQLLQHEEWRRGHEDAQSKTGRASRFEAQLAFGGAAIGAMGLGAGRLMAGYRLFAAAVLLTLVTSVHFVGEEREAPIRDIYAVYDSPV